MPAGGRGAGRGSAKGSASQVAAAAGAKQGNGPSTSQAGSGRSSAASGSGGRGSSLKRPNQAISGGSAGPAQGDAPAPKKPRGPPKGRRTSASKAGPDTANREASAQKPPAGPPGAQAPPTNPSGPARKAARKVDDALDIVGDIVDIEGEEDMLVGSGAGVASGSANEVETDAARFLTTASLRSRIEASLRQRGMSPELSGATLDAISLGARERLVHVIERMRSAAAVRTGNALAVWNTKPVGSSMYHRMQQQRNQEQRALDAEAQVRRDKLAKAAAQAAEATADADLSAKEAAASAEAKRKEEAKREKQRITERSQRAALMRVMGKMTKKRDKTSDKTGSKKSAGSKSVGSGNDRGNTGASGIAKRNGAGESSKNSTQEQKSMAKSGGDHGKGSASKDRGAVTLPNDGRSAPKEAQMPKPVIMLEDVLFVLESERVSKKSPLLSKWRARHRKGKPSGAASGVRK